LTWLSVKEAAQLRNCTESAIKKAVKKGTYGKEDEGYRYVNGLGQGGRQLQIALESLPQAAQDEYNNTANQQPNILYHTTGKQREKADFKAWAVEWFRQSGMTSSEFVDMFNAENPEEYITANQLLSWNRKYQNRSVMNLLDGRGGYNKGQNSISDEAWQCFYDMYMTQQRRGVRLCYDLTKRIYPDIPSVSTFERRVREIPHYAILYYRHGEKTFKDNLPSMTRSRLDINSNDIWFSDHHEMDVFVLNKQGKAVRPWLTTFYDARSNKVIAFLLREDSPNTTAVKQCLRRGMETHGVPKEVYFDNGKDYRSKSFDREYPMSLVNQIGFNIIYATPYHGQAKTVERFHGTLEERFNKRFITYAGRDAKNRPECMQISNEEIAKIAPTIEEYESLLSAYIEEYNQTASNGRDMNGQSPNQVYYDNLKVKRQISDHDALRILCGNFHERTVQKNGIRIMNNLYQSDYLTPFYNQKVTVVFDPDNIEEVNVFDMNNKAICVAYAQISTPFRNTTDVDYQKAAKEKKKVRSFIKNYAPSRESHITQIIARNQLEEKLYEEGRDTSIIEQISPQSAQNSKTLRTTAKAGESRPKPEDDLRALLMGVKVNVSGG
jgi:transposase InsO family protein